MWWPNQKSKKVIIIIIIFIYKALFIKKISKVLQITIKARIHNKNTKVYKLNKVSLLQYWLL